MIDVNKYALEPCITTSAECSFASKQHHRHIFDNTIDLFVGHPIKVRLDVLAKCCYHIDSTSIVGHVDGFFAKPVFTQSNTLVDVFDWCWQIVVVCIKARYTAFLIRLYSLGRCIVDHFISIGIVMCV